MNFFLQEQKIDLGDTSVENIFIIDYMPMADGTYVKVYLLGYKYACDINERDKFNNENIAKNLKIPLSDVLNAWSFWEEEGLVIKHVMDDEYNYMVEFVNLKQLYIDNVYKYVTNQNTEKTSNSTNDDIISVGRNPDIKKMLEEIGQMFGRPMTVNENKKIISWMNNYGMKPDVMVQAFSYCINNKKVKRLNYIETVVSSWHDEGVCDTETMAQYLERRDDRFYIYSRISKALGFTNRALTEGEMKTIDKWVDDWNFSMEMILKCLENSTKISNPNINYFDSIMDKWYKKGYKDIEDLKNDKKAEEKPKTKQASQPQTKNKFHNFEQKIKNYSEKELEQIGRRNFEKKLEELGINIVDERNGKK